MRVADVFFFFIIIIMHVMIGNALLPGIIYYMCIQSLKDLQNNI